MAEVRRPYAELSITLIMGLVFVFLLLPFVQSWFKSNFGTGISFYVMPAMIMMIVLYILLIVMPPANPKVFPADKGTITEERKLPKT